MSKKNRRVQISPILDPKLKIGDLVAFDCYNNSPFGSLGRVVKFEVIGPGLLLGGTPAGWVVLTAGSPPQLYRRRLEDLKKGLIRKLSGGVPCE